MDQLTIVEKNGENYVLLELSGGINSYTAAEFRNKVFNYIQTTNLVLDLSMVNAIDSTGMGIIMAAFNDGVDTNHVLYLMNPSVVSRQSIEDTGFADMFHIIHSVTEIN